MILSLLNPSNWFGQGRTKLSGGADNQGEAGAGGNAANKPVTLDTALTLSAFWAAVRLTSETIATLPLPLYQRQRDGSRAVAVDHPLHGLLVDSPNADQTAAEFWEGIVAWSLVWGNGYAEKSYRGDGAISSLLPLRADMMRVRRDREGALRYHFTDRGKSEELPEDKVFHLRGFGFGGDVGLSVIQYGRQTLGSAMAAEEASGSTFANGMKMSGWLKADVPNKGMLTQDQRDQAKRVLIDPYTGAGNTARVGILEGPFDWLPANMMPEDSQLLQTRGFNVEDVCRWMGIPPVLVGHASQGQTMWGSGIEQIIIGWLTLSLRARLRKLQLAVKRSLLSPADRGRFYAEHVIEALLQADSAARGELYWKLIQVGAMTPNQIAQKENFATFEGGDVRLVNSTLVPLDRAGADRISTKGGGPNAGLPFGDDEWKAFDPSKHPRDEFGRWNGNGGHGRRAARLARLSLEKPSFLDDVELGRVSGARFTHAARRDVDGWRFSLTSDRVRHAYDRHGPGSADRNPIAARDFENLPRVVGAGTVKSGGLTRRDRLQTIIVEHRTRGTTYRAVLTVHKRTRTLNLLTLSKEDRAAR